MTSIFFFFLKSIWRSNSQNYSLSLETWDGDNVQCNGNDFKWDAQNGMSTTLSWEVRWVSNFSHNLTRRSASYLVFFFFFFLNEFKQKYRCPLFGQMGYVAKWIWRWSIWRCRQRKGYFPLSWSEDRTTKLIHTFLAILSIQQWTWGWRMWW